jgi:hypothetical protein
MTINARYFMPKIVQGVSYGGKFTGHVLQGRDASGAP